MLRSSKLPKSTLVLRTITAALLVGILGIGGYAAYAYAASPDVIRKPQSEHYHLRMQILVNGKAENFADKKYQVGYSKDQCNANLPEQPIHFHDNKDQFVHIHWEGMTGGMVLKYFGWNYIGGMNNALGYKLDNLKDIQKVTTHGDYLPAVPNDAKFFVYVGSSSAYSEKSFEDFKSQDLEKFFGKTSNSPLHDANQQKTSLLDKLVPAASAHAGETHETASVPETEEQKLTRINNLIGDVVIFVQKDRPTKQEIENRFNKLEPLGDSTCGG